VRIDEAGHYYPSPAVDNAGLQPARFGVKIVGCSHLKNLSVGSEHRPVRHDSDLAQVFTTARSGWAGKGQELFSMAEKERRRWWDRHLTKAEILLE
jgi:hypothetical protein